MSTARLAFQEYPIFAAFRLTRALVRLSFHGISLTYLASNVKGSPTAVAKEMPITLRPRQPARAPVLRRLKVSVTMIALQITCIKKTESECGNDCFTNHLY